MELERAQEIVKAINDRCFFKMELVETMASLEGVTLAEMVEAAKIIREKNASAEYVEGKRSISLVPDDRLIAAAYCLDHYHPDNEPIIIKPHAGIEGDILALAVVAIDRPKDDEEEGE